MNIELLISLLRQTCTINQVRNALRSAEISAIGASWEELISSTLRPSLKDGSFKTMDAVRLLHEVEEHGNQHVFVYSIEPKTISPLFDLRSLKSILAAANLDSVMENPLLLDKPKKRTVAEVRWDDLDGEKTFVLKQVMKHEHNELVNSGTDSSGQLVRRYNKVEERIVDLLRVSQNGQVEVRLSRRTSESNYNDFLTHFWNSVSSFLAVTDTKEVSLTKAKNYLLQSSTNLSHLVRYHASTLGNDYGYSAKFATGTKDDDLTTDSACKTGVDAFYSHHGHCSELNISLKKQTNGIPSRDIRVRIGGHINEFVLTQRCDRSEYEYVVAQIRKFNK